MMIMAGETEFDLQWQVVLFGQRVHICFVIDEIFNDVIRA
jgi:hypothetical protein